jgi:hypothetical protein
MHTIDSVPTSAPTLRTGISLPTPLYQWAQGDLSQEGFTTFSGYLEFLIRLRKQRTRATARRR